MAKTRIRTDIFRGLNRRDGAGEGAFLDVSGLSTDAYPAARVRPGRSRVGSWTRAKAIYETDGHKIVVDGNKLYYDNRELRDVTPDAKQFAELGRKVVIWPDKIYVNLNTGTAHGMTASVSGRFRQRGGVLTVNTETTTGTVHIENAYGYSSRIKAGSPYFLNAYMELFENLHYDEGWLYDYVETWLPMPDNPEDMSADFTTEEYANRFFFVAREGAPVVARSDDGTASTVNWPRNGTMYGKITGMTVENVNHQFDEETGELVYASYDVSYSYEVYNAAADGLGGFLRAGEAVEVTGSKLEYNNKEAAVISAVAEEQITVGTGFVNAAQYYNVTETLQPGAYSLGGVKFKTERKIAASEQLFAVTDKGSSELVDGSVYAYDIQSKALEQMTATEEDGTELTPDSYTGETEEVLTVERSIPDMDFICERDNRLYGVSNNETERIFNTETGKWETVTSRVLHASALGEPTSWNVFEGTNLDSYAVAVAGDGDFTGLVNYSGSLIAFKENRMYKLTGNYPAEFYLRNYSFDGMKAGCHKSAVVINEVLYYLSPYGVMAYSGGAPSLVSYDLGDVQTDSAVGGRDGTNYLLQMGGMLYCYDARHQIWTCEDYGEVTDIHSAGNRAYIVADGRVMATSDEKDAERVNWYAVSHWLDEGTFALKDYGEMNIDAELADGAEMKIEFRMSEDETWRTLKTLTCYHAEWQTRNRLQGERRHAQFMVPAARTDRVQFRLSGTGQCKIYAIDRVVQVASDKP